ncbi:hypothetical protein X757_06855 [Mesorhizobium sp. LSHC414A00]|nr:hypothetical protein X757_06855 [Mesorhizobium sp. LSHC414A00]ESZ24641.1 hypothetical protein X733_31665 [Mesorhizobium sp. L2C067A000]
MLLNQVERILSPSLRSDFRVGFLRMLLICAIASAGAGGFVTVVQYLMFTPPAPVAADAPVLLKKNPPKKRIWRRALT